VLLAERVVLTPIVGVAPHRKQVRVIDAEMAEPLSVPV
jgi:hypothetical protein